MCDTKPLSWHWFCFPYMRKRLFWVNSGLKVFLSACIYNKPFHQGALNIIMCRWFFFKFQSVSILTIHYNRYGREQFQIMPFSNIFKKPKLDHYKLLELINLLMQIAWNSPFDKIWASWLTDTPYGNVDPVFKYFKELLLCHSVKVS